MSTVVRQAAALLGVPLKGSHKPALNRENAGRADHDLDFDLDEDDDRDFEVDEFGMHSAVTAL